MKRCIESPIALLAAILAVASQAEGQDKPAPLAAATLGGNQTIATPYGTLELRHNYLTDESSRLLFDAMDLQRTSQAYIWSTAQGPSDLEAAPQPSGRRRVNTKRMPQSGATSGPSAQ